ncbi:MAG: YjgN family protein [Methylocystis sp.]
MNDMTIGAAQDAPQAGGIVFTGRDDEFRDILRKGALLEVVTFGFYRFWLATKIRQHLWSHTILDGDAFAYLGTARELLIGFFFAIAILAPIYLASFLLGVEAERSQAFASLLVGVFFLAFWQFAIYRARRYRLHRTAWRGLRFHMDGSGVSYALRAMGWGLVTIVTLGLALPWMQAGLERYKMRHTYYGDLRGDFVATGGDFLKQGWLLWIGAAFSTAAYFAGPILYELTKHGAWFLLMLPTLPAAVSIYARFKAAQWKWWLEGVRIGDVQATSTLERHALTGNYWTFVGLLFASLLAAGMGVTLAVAFLPKILGVVLAVLFYLALIVQYSILWRTYFVQRVWRIVVNSLMIHNLHTAQEVAMRLDASSPTALGEGFADSLDVAGF